MATHFVEYENIVPLVAPIDGGASAVYSPYMDLKYAHKAAFLLYFGVITTGTAADHVDVTIECASTAASGSDEAAVPFRYRTSEATGGTSWGAITTAATTGFAVASTDDGKAFWLEVDPADVQAEKSDARYVRVAAVNTGLTAWLYTCIGFQESRIRALHIPAVT